MRSRWLLVLALGHAADVSDDGRAIVGAGTDPEGYTEASMARPEPDRAGGAALLAPAVLAGRRFR